MKARNLINKLLDCSPNKNVGIAVQNEDGSFTYYTDFCFNPETGDIVVSEKEEDVGKLPNSYAVYCKSEEEYRKMMKHIYSDASDSEVDFLATLLSVIPSAYPLYAHVADEELVKYSKESEELKTFTVKEYIEMKRREK